VNPDRIVVDPADFRVDVLRSSTDEASSACPLFAGESGAARPAVVITLDDLNYRDGVIAHTFDRTRVRFTWPAPRGGGCRRPADWSGRRPGRVLEAPATRALIRSESWPMPIQQQQASPNDNRSNGPSSWIDPTVWTRIDVRRALAVRDIGTVYRILQRYGVAQRRIAAMTDQSQSEVSEIIAGRRTVVSYDVLVRIADGLDVPRGWMGLATSVEEGHNVSPYGERRPEC
jgi:Helix-turn-helix